MSVHATDDDGVCFSNCPVCKAEAELAAAKEQWRSLASQAKDERERREAKRPILDAFDRLSAAVERSKR